MHPTAVFCRMMVEVDQVKAIAIVGGVIAFIGAIVMGVCGGGLMENMTYADANMAVIVGGSIMLAGLAIAWLGCIIAGN